MRGVVAGGLACIIAGLASAHAIPDAAAIDAEVHKVITASNANGLALAVIDHGKVGYVHAYGIRNAKGDPLTTSTVMYGASLTKTVFAYVVVHLADQDRLKLDPPTQADPSQPFPHYDPDRACPATH